MGTRSTIAILYETGKVRSIYAHWDGYPTGNGATLYEHYTDFSKIKKLIRNGNISSLQREISPPAGQNHSEKERYPGVTTFHKRDFDDENSVPRDCRAKTYKSLDEYFKKGKFQEYDYIFSEKDNIWFVIDSNYNKLKRLDTVIREYEKFPESDISKFMAAKEMSNSLENKDSTTKKHTKKI